MPVRTATVHWLQRKPLPPSYRKWMLNEKSLTGRLKAVARRFEVEVLWSGVARLTLDERRALGSGRDCFGFVRQVRLRVDGQAVVLARSALTLPSQRRRWKQVRAIGTRPLGAALWTNPAVKRGPLEFAELTSAHPLYRALKRRDPALEKRLPARRSLFWWGGEPLLVMEAFLPAILEWPCPETP